MSFAAKYRIIYCHNDTDSGVDEKSESMYKGCSRPSILSIIKNVARSIIKKTAQIIIVNPAAAMSFAIPDMHPPFLDDLRYTSVSFSLSTVKICDIPIISNMIIRISEKLYSNNLLNPSLFVMLLRFRF